MSHPTHLDNKMPYFVITPRGYTKVVTQFNGVLFTLSTYYHFDGQIFYKSKQLKHKIG